jgi:deoxycytidylate deaminase
MNIKEMKQEAEKSPCKVIKFSANDGKSTYSYNGEFYADCENCKRTEIEQPYPDCKANHAEWGMLAKLNRKGKSTEEMYIYCMTPEGKDYPFTRFWCRTCAILIPMFGVKAVFMWDGKKWLGRDAKNLIDEVEKIKN